MTARMQAATASGLPVLLRYDLLAGHSGAGALSSYIDRQVDELAFLYSQLGVR
jgi:prolyl oligopeptidase